MQITLDVFLPDTWGADCAMPQIWKQARESVMGVLEKGIRRELLNVVGVARVTAIMVEEE